MRSLFPSDYGTIQMSITQNYRVSSLDFYNYCRSGRVSLIGVIDPISSYFYLQVLAIKQLKLHKNPFYKYRYTVLTHRSKQTPLSTASSNSTSSSKTSPPENENPSTITTPSIPQTTNTPLTQKNETKKPIATNKLIASLSVAGGLALLVLGGVLLKDQIKSFLDLFIDLVDNWGPLGYIAYIAVYSGLELLAVPAIPLTMTAGAIFGVIPGTMIVSFAATVAATGAFLISRYIARDKVLEWAKSNPKFAAIDKAIGKDGFRVVALLRLSPLLPLAASNYLYGLTSVDIASYVAASWIGMLPGTLAYVAAGTYGKELLIGEGLGVVGSGTGGFQAWHVALAVGFTGLAVYYVGKLAKNALAELESGGDDDDDDGISRKI